MEVNTNHTTKLEFFALKALPVALIALMSLLYSTTLGDLATRWMKWDENLSHGFVIVAIFIFFLFKAAPVSFTQDKLPIRIISLLGLAALSIFWYATKITNIYILEQLSLLGIIVFLFAAAFGICTAREHFILLLLPVFAIPIWDQLNNTLVNWSAFVVGELVRLMAMPAVIDGNSIFIPDGEIVIADGCSGLRYFTISLAIAYLISYLNNYSIKKLALMLLVAATIGLITNWLRIFLLVIIGYETKMQSSLMSEHEYFGWFLFALIAFPAIYFAPVVKNTIKKTPVMGYSPGWIALSAIALSIGPALSFALNHEPEAYTIEAQLNHEYRPTLESRMPIRVKVSGSDKIENAVTDDQIYIQINHFQRKNASDKLVPYAPRLFDHEVWSLQSERESSIGKLNLKTQILRNKRSGKFVAQNQWFEIAGVTAASYPVAKLLQIPAIMRNMNSFTIYTTQTVCADATCTEEINRLITRSKSLTQHL